MALKYRMSYYWDPRFMNHLQGDIRVVCEVGARHGDESIILSNVFKDAKILSFECNPNTVKECEDKLKSYSNIKFFNHGLGEKDDVLPFYSFDRNNDGASSLYKRIDYDRTQQHTGDIIIKTLDSVLIKENIECIDLLCMDVQGYELNVLKGCKGFLKNIKYIIMEEPKPIINTDYLPAGVHSSYIGAPTSFEIKEFMNSNNFIEIERIPENLIEDNVMYKRVEPITCISMPASCIPKYKLFNMDLHISVIADFKNLFPEFDIIDWCMSGHSWVFNRKQESPKYINPSTWIGLNEDMIKAFQKEYDSILKTFDGFICGHPNGFIPIFEKYGKPIIMINSCRYDLPYCWSKNYKMLESYKECLTRLKNKRLLISVSNNKADQLYIKMGCGIDTVHIPSLCAYTGMKYNAKRATFLSYNIDLPKHPLITNKSELEVPYKWSDIAEFKGIIHTPYEISTMSMFEHFTAGIPLFFPSKELMLEKINIQSVNAYWKSDLPKELEFFSNKSAWIDLADFYEVFKSPNVYIYNSFQHLIKLLEEFEWKDDSDILDEYKSNIKSEWISLLSRRFDMRNSF
jgi:FkbM family methyltransferase